MAAKNSQSAQQLSTPGQLKPRTVRVTDAELQAMAKLDQILASLDSRTCDRVVKWIVDRYATEAVEPVRYAPASWDGPTP